MYSCCFVYKHCSPVNNSNNADGMMHQSIPAATIPSTGLRGVFACLIVPMAGDLQLHVHLGAGPLSIWFITSGHLSLTEKRQQPCVLVVFSLSFY